MFYSKDIIDRVFDLKGSKVDRITKDYQVSSLNKTKALKDLDFQWLNETYGIADFSSDVITELNEQLERDLIFLRDLNLMDYSLLLIILKFPDDFTNNNEEFDALLNLFGDPKYYRKIYKSRTSKYLYCMGIIDYLQIFNMSKFLENKFKTLSYCSEVKNISAVDPITYAQRMKDFLKENLFVSNKFKNN